VAGFNRDEAGRAIRRLPEEVFLSAKLAERKLPGRGNSHTKLVTFEHAIELVMVLPGRVAKETRTQFANIIRRYLAGDHSLILEIQANAHSSSPVAQLARESLGITTDEDLIRKRRREDLELEMLQIERDERRNQVALLLQQSQQSNFKFLLDNLLLLDPNWKRDERLVVQTKDLLKNICFGSQQSAITNGDDTSQSKPITISEIALELGHGRLTHGDACKIGKKAIELYREKHNADPPKRLQFVDGAERLVNAYTESDRDMLVRAVNLAM